MAAENPFYTILKTLEKPNGGEFGKYYCLPALNDPRIDKLPYSIKILLESAIRNCDEFQVKSKDIEKIIDWENTSPKQVEIPFKPARVLLQIFRLLRYFEIFWIDRSWTDFGGSTLVYSTTFFYLPR
ncbi:hypothetical protein V6N13_044137 [Hibiscus sabdariffa]